MIPLKRPFFTASGVKASEMTRDTEVPTYTFVLAVNSPMGFLMEKREH